MHTRALVGKINGITIKFNDESTERHHCRHLHARVSGERVHVEIKNERVIVKRNIDKNKEKALIKWVKEILNLIRYM